MSEPRNPFEAPRTDSVPRRGADRLLRWTWVRPVVFGVASMLAVISGSGLAMTAGGLEKPVGDPATKEAYNRLAITAGVFAGSTFVAFATGVSMLVRRNSRRRRLQKTESTDAETFTGVAPTTRLSVLPEGQSERIEKAP